ncbi:MAG: FAD-dependent oxidoreductase [Sulfurimonas sp.]
MKKVAIIGAGLLGRVTALNLLEDENIELTIYEKAGYDGEGAAASTAAGMLAPFAELETAESVILDHGLQSIKLWPSLLEKIGIPEAFQQEGSIITAHPQDLSELRHFISTLHAKVPAAKEIKTLGKRELTELEPSLTHHSQAFHLYAEGQVNSAMFIEASTQYLLDHPRVTWYENHPVDEGLSDVEDFNAVHGTDFDWVFDTRGLGAKAEMPDLRGVRGEVFWIDAPEVDISRPTRLMHPRYKIYIVPRANHRFVIGATEIESEDDSPMSVRSSLELLSAVYSMHPSFAEARIVKTTTDCRPSLEDNLPRIEQHKGLTRINGLYRHGYLLAPAIVEEALKNGIRKSA